MNKMKTEKAEKKAGKNVRKSDGKKVATVAYSYSRHSLSAYRMPNEILSPSPKASPPAAQKMESIYIPLLDCNISFNKASTTKCTHG